MERESIEVDVLFVGAGPASLAGALHLSNLIRRGGVTPPLQGTTIAIIEKGREINSHAISGAVLDPIALKELIPDFIEKGVPIENPVTEDHFIFLSRKWKFEAPINPPPLRNHGNYIISLSKFVKWLAGLVEKNGVDLFPGFSGTELLFEGDRVVGVRTRDHGIDKQGNRKQNFQPGVDIRAKVVLLGEGPRGTLTKQLIQKFQLNEGKDPDVYSLGIKEIWELPKGRAGLKPAPTSGRVIHTMGFPLKNETFGGGFLYNMANDLLDIGFVVGLDYKDPSLDPHHEFQRFKTHPYIKTLLIGGKMLEYGAKTIPEGGYYSVPKLYTDGCLLIGDSANLLNPMRLKGIHMAMKSGMLAAEAVNKALLKNDFSEETLSRYEKLVQESWIWKELYGVRNFHQGFRHGLWGGFLNAGLSMITGGRGLWEHSHVRPGHLEMKKLEEYNRSAIFQSSNLPILFDDGLTFSKVRDVFASGTMHEENQPSHLRIADFDICNNRCTVEYGNPCRNFCPANVYEMVGNEDGKGKHLQINASNCVHCKTCDIMDPYGIITWVPPEGGGGPGYKNL